MGRARLVLIGCLLAGVAILLATECKKLLIGERARPELRRHLREIAEGTDGVCSVNEIITVHLAPQDVIATLSLDFDDDLKLTRVEEIADAIERQVKSRYPEVRRLFIRPQSRAAAEDERDALETKSPAASGEDGRG